MRLVGFNQGRVTLELESHECQFLSRACQAVLSGDAGSAMAGAVAASLGEGRQRLPAYRSLGRALLACARVGHRQDRAAHGLTVTRTLSLTDRRPTAIVTVD
jgi:hypothetical protein